MDAGEFGYIWGLGWVWWRAKHVTNSWHTCPFCGRGLPQMERLVQDGVSGGWKQEDGNEGQEA